MTHHKVLDDTFGDEGSLTALESAEDTPTAVKSTGGHSEPPACFLEEITGEYVLVFPSGRKQKYRSKAVAREIASHYGQEEVTFLPYREIYDPTQPNLPVSNTDGLVLNVYERSGFQGQTAKVAAPKFPSIEALLENVMPDKVGRDAFLNWLSVIFNTGKKTGTAWVILGSQGSGKTMLFERVLTPLLGEDNCTELNQDALSSRFNHLLHRKQLVCFNEVHSSKQAAERIKTWVTEDQIRLEDKTVRASINRNYLNLIFTSNSQVPVALEADDRRFNVVRTGGPLTELLGEHDLSELSNLDNHLTKDLVLKLAEGISGESMTMTKLTRELKSRGISESRGKADGSIRKREYTWQSSANSDKSDKASE